VVKPLTLIAAQHDYENRIKWFTLQQETSHAKLHACASKLMACTHLSPAIVKLKLLEH